MRKDNKTTAKANNTESQAPVSFSHCARANFSTRGHHGNDLPNCQKWRPADWRGCFSKCHALEHKTPKRCSVVHRIRKSLSEEDCWRIIQSCRNRFWWRPQNAATVWHSARFRELELRVRSDLFDDTDYSISAREASTEINAQKTQSYHGRWKVEIFKQNINWSDIRSVIPTFE
jgi:hypothetical protein